MSVNYLPTISIVMPVLNMGETIEKAIKSVINQDYPNFELIIIDGGSTDRTVDIIKRYERYITYWHSATDENPVIAANKGILKAKGDLIALLMADDWYEHNLFAKIADSFINQPDADIVTCGGRIVYFDEKTNTYKVKMTFLGEKQMQLNFNNICFGVSAICCRFIHKSFYERVGLYISLDSQGKYMFTNDKEFLLRAVLHNVKTVFVNELGHNYLASKKSSTFGNHKPNILRMCREHMEIAQNFLKKDLLSGRQRYLLKIWYNDQVTRLLWYSLLDFDFREAYAYAKEGLINYQLFWLIIFIYTTAKITLKKLFHLFRKNSQGLEIGRQIQ